METIYLLIGCSVLVAAGFLCAFLWAVRAGQFDDLVTPAYRSLFDEPASAPASGTPQTTNNNDSSPVYPDSRL